MPKDAVVIAAEMEAMEQAGKKAAAELDKLATLPEGEIAIGLLATWWSKYYLKAGHKRLGRELLLAGKKQRIAEGKVKTLAELIEKEGV